MSTSQDDNNRKHPRGDGEGEEVNLLHDQEEQESSQKRSKTYFKAACERVDDNDIWCILLLVDLPSLNYSEVESKEKIVAGLDVFTSNPKTTEIVAQLIIAPASELVQFLGECIVHKCVYLWHTRKFNLIIFFVGKEINKGYAWNRMIYDLITFITHDGKRIAASLLRRKQFAKCRDALGKSPQGTSQLAMECALDIALNIQMGIGNYVLHGGKSLLHCCLENTQFKYIGRKETACLIAYTLHKNLMIMMMHSL
mmetsp:Transcript_9250/g.14232  ORF Transcript_9250/g.14232 Transcript_9250/m.14232 type:complete len:254 (-) Transcript_9250:34-795(-)